MRKALPLASLVVLMFFLAAVCPAADLYITQNTSGSDSGANCANAHSASWFNSNAAGGNIYHLCGTFTGSAGQNMLVAPAGSAGNTLTILFEPGAIMTSPHWGTNDGTYPTGGAITVNNYVTVDGGSNGIIQNTQNGAAGTSCPGGTCTSNISAAIYVAPGKTDVEIRNLKIQNIFLCNSSSSCGSFYSSGIKSSGSKTNFSVHDNVITGTSVGIYLEYSGSVLNNVNIYNNTLSDQYWGINVGSGSSGNSTTNVNIYGNMMSNFDTWQNTTAHEDGIIVFSTSAANVFNIYNNFISAHGNLTGNVFCTYGGASPGASCNIFNNVLYVNNNTCSAIGGGRAIWMHGGSGPHALMNNTVIGPGGTCPLIYLESPTSVTRFQNNLLTGSTIGVENGQAFSGSFSNADYNLYYNITYPGLADGSTNTYYTLTQWKSLGFDAHAVTGNPNLDSNYMLQAGSAAIGAGTNLTSLGITALDSDKAGGARPGSGAWDIGAFQYGSQTGSIDPPSGLSATVK